MLVAALAAAALAVAGCSDQQAGSLDMAPPSSTSAGDDIAIDAAPYRCLAAWPTAQELDGLADLPSPDEAVFAAAVEAFGPMGDRTGWAVLGSGWLVDRRPLEGEGGLTGLVVATPDGAAVLPCVPWSEATGALWSPGPTGGAGAAPVDAAGLGRARCEAIGSAGGIHVAWWDLPPGTSWELRVDGTELGSGAVGPEPPSVSGLQAAFDERLTAYGRQPSAAPPAADPTADGDPTAPQGVRDDFAALGGPLGVARTYEMVLTVGGTEDTVPCGSATIPAELPVPACTLTLAAGVPQISLAEDTGLTYAPDGLAVSRDGVPVPLDGSLGGTRTDLTATPGSHHYTVEISDPLAGRATVTTDCGSITVPEPASRADVLQAARNVFHWAVMGPYLYVRAERGGEPVDLVLRYGDGGFGFDPAHPADESLNPYTIHDQLISAIDAGTPVTFELDPATGLPLTWTIDGVTRAYRCVNADTAPPELRASAACDDSHNRLSPAP